VQRPVASHERRCDGPSRDRRRRNTGTLVRVNGAVAGRGAPAQRGPLAAALSRLKTFATCESLFPRGTADDEDRQQIDLREVNSWRLRMHEVETPELLEVQLVNAIAPYILNARLKPLIGVPRPGVTSMSSTSAPWRVQFYRTTKTGQGTHHTNMAKSAAQH